jgi:hypothetical protein
MKCMDDQEQDSRFVQAVDDLIADRERDDAAKVADNPSRVEDLAFLQKLQATLLDQLRALPRTRKDEV